MKKLHYVMLLLFAFTLFLPDKAQSQEKKEAKTEMKKESKSEKTTYNPWNTICPVMGEEVDNTVKTVVYNNKEYGFCCKSCIKKFEKNPEKYSKKLSEDGKSLIK